MTPDLSVTIDSLGAEFSTIINLSDRFAAMENRLSALNADIADFTTAKKTAESNIARARAHAAISGKPKELDLLDDPEELAKRVTAMEVERAALQELIASLGDDLAKQYEKEVRLEIDSCVADSHARQRHLLQKLARLALANGVPRDELPRRLPTALAAVESFDIDRAGLASRLAAVGNRYPLNAILRVVVPNAPSFPGRVSGQNPAPTPDALSNFRWFLPVPEQVSVIKAVMIEKPAAN
jgi:hypothetical protein